MLTCNMCEQVNDCIWCSHIVSFCSSPLNLVICVHCGPPATPQWVGDDGPYWEAVWYVEKLSGILRSCLVYVFQTLLLHSNPVNEEILLAVNGYAALLLHMCLKKLGSMLYQHCLSYFNNLWSVSTEVHTYQVCIRSLGFLHVRKCHLCIEIMYETTCSRVYTHRVYLQQGVYAWVYHEECAVNMNVSIHT